MRDHFPHVGQILEKLHFGVRLYSHPREYRKKFLANCLCIGFVHRNKSEAKQYDFRINFLQNYESESESEIRGEVSM